MTYHAVMAVEDTFQKNTKTSNLKAMEKIVLGLYIAKNVKTKRRKITYEDILKVKNN